MELNFEYQKLPHILLPMRTLQILQIDSFTREKFKGNPAGVVLNADGLNEAEMLQIARELNNSETAFLHSPDSVDCDAVIRYFTPKVEVPTCGHATIAALYAIALERKSDSCVFHLKTRIGVLPCEIQKIRDSYHMVMTQGKFELSPTLESEVAHNIATALGLSASDLDERCPIQIASTGHSKVMIGIKSRSVLNSLAPDYFTLASLSKLIHCNGYYVFTFDSDESDILIHGRMFAPVIGINEDPVTGNANGPLGGYLVKNKIVRMKDGVFAFAASQGEAMGRKGIIHVKVDVLNDEPVRIQISGEAVVVFRTSVSI